MVTVRRLVVVDQHAWPSRCPPDPTCAGGACSAGRGARGGHSSRSWPGAVGSSSQDRGRLGVPRRAVTTQTRSPNERTVVFTVAPAARAPRRAPKCSCDRPGCATPRRPGPWTSRSGAGGHELGEQRREDRRTHSASSSWSSALCSWPAAYRRLRSAQSWSSTLMSPETPAGSGVSRHARSAAPSRHMREQRLSVVHPGLDEHPAERLDVERAQRRRARCACSPPSPDGWRAGAPGAGRRGLGGEQLGVLLRVGRVPGVGLGVGNPQAGLADPVEADDDVDGRVLPAGSGSLKVSRMARLVTSTLSLG